MSIFDKLRGQLTPQPTAPESNSKKETFTFAELPERLAQLQALPEAALTSTSIRTAGGSTHRIVWRTTASPYSTFLRTAHWRRSDMPVPDATHVTL